MTTMVDIAKRAGVALSTVSHTLSGKRPVSQEVRERVLKAMEELDYQPSALGRALRNKSTQTIALLYPSLSGSRLKLSFEFVSGIVEVTNQKKYGLLLWTTTEEDQAVVRMAQQGFIDGLILMEIRMKDPRVETLKKYEYPFTMIGHCAENDGINFVDLDFDYAVHTCVEYLVKQGHSHIALLDHAVIPPETKSAYIVRIETAFSQAMTKWQLQGVYVTCGFDSQAGYDATLQLLTDYPTVTAIITSNPWICGGITRAIYDKDLRIPEDISLVGILNPGIAEMTTPPITAIDFPFQEMGRMGADMLLRQLEGEEVAMQVLLKPPLTIRQSSGPCKGGL